MTDNEIIKALEEESTPSELNCVHGEYVEACGIYCAKKHENAKYCHDCKEHSMAYYGRRAKATLDLINRQKAEIERLKQECSVEVNKTLMEFAKRLKKKETTAISCKRFEGVISTDDIDNLVKEFTEGSGNG